MTASPRPARRPIRPALLRDSVPMGTATTETLAQALRVAAALARGACARVEYAAALASADLEQRRGVFDNLRVYCARDTLAMAEVRRVLAAIAAPCPVHTDSTTAVDSVP